MNEPVLVTAEGGRDRRALKLLGGGLLVLLLVGVVVPKVLFGGGGDEVPLPVSGTGSSPVVPLAAPPAETAIQSVGSFSAKDPFAALFAQEAPADAAPPAAPAPPAEPAAIAPEPAPVVPAAPPASGGQTSAAPTPGPAPRVVHTFALREVYTDGGGLPAARVAVDGQEHLVAVGQDFAGSYRTLSLDRSNLCGVFLYGDRRFSLCQGEETQT